MTNGWKKHIEEFVRKSERSAIINLKLSGYKYARSIVQIFLPTEQSNLETINNFYCDLIKAIWDHAHINLIVMEDWNGRNGGRRPEKYAILEQHIRVYINKNRSRNR